MRDRALQDPKYFVMGLIAQPLLESFNSTVSTASVDDLCRSAFTWLDQQCNLNSLRPGTKFCVEFLYYFFLLFNLRNSWI